MDEVLGYDPEGQHNSTVRRRFVLWRESQNPPIPLRCDNPACWFHTEPLVWNGQPLGLILDHVNGVHAENSSENLRFLCPNCNSQLPTHGGGNRGRVQLHPGGYATKDDGGLWQHKLKAEAASYGITGMDAGTRHSDRVDGAKE